MLANTHKRAIVQQLQSRINAMQGLGKSPAAAASKDFAPFDAAFPEHVFPRGVVHEFISHEPAEAASTHGFIAALSGKLLSQGGLCLWITGAREVFAGGLSAFGLPPDRIVFAGARQPKELLWIVEEALKCDALAVVIAQINTLGFTESRRLQLAVERSGVTGFIHRFRPFSANALACTTRWHIAPLPSHTDDGLPGVGHSRWRVELAKVKNGRPFTWQICWVAGSFIETPDLADSQVLPQSHAG